MVRDVKANRIYEIQEQANKPASEPSVSSPSPLFEDVSQLINHSHVDEPFNDFERQPLLPRKLSQLGPGVAWVDLDGDGRDDLVIGTGKGGQLAAFLNNGNGGFSKVSGGVFDHNVNQDQAGIVS